ncbi:GNAT family N-acetyltransferase [Macrococcus capreoli]|uniref:GNAT family N-acetyltransferase n=1 Tax=Macrococcus capreoli TaxID=2982690 RepID=UPI0021D60555|nr:GNAT family N-acetyltransferase [Macrococcus sp. TMW 2.2395]MCU7557989.1 GNAT family N-acetyltransferase [Macrococcus sp. TMW 2.2395]
MDIHYRQLELDDIEAIYDLLTKDETSRYQSWVIETLEDTEQYINQMISLCEQKKMHYRVIEDKDTQKLIGVCRITLNQKHHKGEIGYMIHPDYWGKGIATHAAKDLIRYGFDDLSLNRIYAVTDVRNNGSIRVLEKCGLQREGLMRQDKIIRGNYRDSYMYSILKQEYRG